MTARNGARRLAYLILCAAPLVVLPVAAARALRIPGLHAALGLTLFAALALAAGLLGFREARSDRRLAVAGALLAAPIGLIALLWVGLGTLWNATPPENVMRYEVLLVSAIAVTAGLVLLRDGLTDAGEWLYSGLGFAGALLAGAAYTVWLSYELGSHALRAAARPVPESIANLGLVFDVLLFAACAITYLATAAFGAALGRAGWIGRGAATAYVSVSLIALLFLCLRGLAFPDPNAGQTPWYMRPGFVAGIPAVPWLLPYFMGVALLRRAGPAGGTD